MDTIHGQSNGGKRVVSFFIWDPELERKIDCEVKMIDGISKLLNVATTPEQTIECHKALVLSQQRMLAFMAEIQRKQRNLLKRDNTELEPTKAIVILSDIRIPLVWTNMKGKSEQKKFAVFCLARIGCEIIDTQMKFVDKHATEVLFTDKLTFEHVPHDFQLHLEIYALNKSIALSSSAKDFADRYSYFSVHGSPQLGRKRPEPVANNPKASNEQQSKFILIARTAYQKNSTFKMAKVRNLIMERTQENPLMQLPIHTSFISLFLIQPVCYTRLATFSGIVEIYNVRYTCTLTGGFLNGEEIMHDDYSDQHRFSIPITSETVVLLNQEQLSFSVYNLGFDQEEFFVQDSFTWSNWIRALKQHIVDMRAWQNTFEHLPSIRRYSHQPLTSTPSSSISAKISNKEPGLKTRARSLNNLHQTDLPSEIFRPNRVDERISFNTTFDRHSIDDDDDDDADANDDDDDDVSVYRTRL